MGSFEIWRFRRLRRRAWLAPSHFTLAPSLGGRFYYLHFVGVEPKVQRREGPREMKQPSQNPAGAVCLLWSSCLSLQCCPAKQGIVVGSSVLMPGRLCEAFKKVLHLPEVQGQDQYPSKLQLQVSMGNEVFCPLVDAPSPPLK